MRPFAVSQAVLESLPGETGRALGDHRATVIFEADGGRRYEYPLRGIEFLVTAIQAWRTTGAFDFQMPP
ncbi:MAG: hypothetical protein KKC37_05885 [Proteobacteria bacterium]|nr:hypothetical protein [Pseudomonadota bacterium]